MLMTVLDIVHYNCVNAVERMLTTIDRENLKFFRRSLGGEN